MNIPKDSNILLSYINTQLRDNYKNEITQKLEALGYKYDETSNRFTNA